MTPPAAARTVPSAPRGLVGMGMALVALLLTVMSATAGPTENVIFHANLDEHTEYNDVWGYTAPGGAEYALLGTTSGLAVINVVDPGNPYETGFFPGAISIWRDIKTYSHYAYVVNETAGGLQIVDLADPENPALVGFYTGGSFNTAHNLFIDAATARAYLVGYTFTVGGFIALDLTVPTAPVELGRYTDTYLHDAMVQNGILYGAAIDDPRLRVLDVSNLAGISQLGTAEGYVAAFTHNAWVTPDNAYVMTTDETAGSSCRMWDLSTLPNLVQTDAYRPTPVSVVPHNTHIEGGLAFISFYTLGMKVVDVSDPFNLVEVAAYDTWPSDDSSNFDGCWGVYPFFQTSPNLIVASDIQNGLYVLEYKGPLGTLAGAVTETGAPATLIEGATVEVVNTGVSAATDAAGLYALQDVAGAVSLSVSAYGYETRVIPAVITTGVITTVDVTLDPAPRGSIAGSITDSGTAAPIAGATVDVLATPLQQVSDGAGGYQHAAVPVGTYTMRVFAFGYRPMHVTVTISDGAAMTVDFALVPAATVNDFESGQGTWAVVSTASRGRWELADPEVTFSGGTPVQPGDDHTPAPGTMCFVTDATAGPAAGTWDVDDGTTVLTSPLTSTFGMADPHVRYSRWYSTGVGNPNLDAFVVELSTNGGGTWPIQLENTDATTNAWIDVDIALNAFAFPTNLMRFRFTAQDTGAGGIVEAALDDFMVYDGFDLAAGTHAPFPLVKSRGLSLSTSWPNPFRSGQESRAEFVIPAGSRVTAGIFDVAGRRVASLMDEHREPGAHVLVWTGLSDAGRASPPGVYFLRVDGGSVVRSRKITLIK